MIMAKIRDDVEGRWVLHSGCTVYIVQYNTVVNNDDDCGDGWWWEVWRKEVGEMSRLRIL